MAVNILNEAGDCTHTCTRPMSGHAIKGDVRVCTHKRIWYCVDNSNGRMWTVEGFWRKLNPVFDFFQYRKAKKALRHYLN